MDRLKKGTLVFVHT